MYIHAIWIKRELSTLGNDSFVNMTAYTLSSIEQFGIFLTTAYTFIHTYPYVRRLHAPAINYHRIRYMEHAARFRPGQLLFFHAKPCKQWSVVTGYPEVVRAS